MKVFRKPLYAWIALLGIVFSQLAVSAYACPVLTFSDKPQSLAMMADMAGMPCAEMDTNKEVGRTALCRQHCDQGNQSVASMQSPDLQPALVLLLVVPSLRDSEPVDLALLQTQLLARTTAPPPLWRTGRLRI